MDQGLIELPCRCSAAAFLHGHFGMAVHAKSFAVSLCIQVYILHPVVQKYISENKSMFIR